MAAAQSTGIYLFIDLHKDRNIDGKVESAVFKILLPQGKIGRQLNIPTLSVAHTSKPSQQGSRQTPHNTGITKSSQSIATTYAGTLTSSFTDSNGQTGTRTSLWRSSTSDTSRSNTSSSTPFSNGTGNLKFRTVTPLPNGTNDISSTARLGEVGNQIPGTGISVLGISQHPTMTKTISDTSPIDETGSQRSGTGSIAPRTNTPYPSGAITVSKTPHVRGTGSQKSGTGTSVSMMTTKRVSVTNTASKTTPVGGQERWKQRGVKENGGNSLVHDKSLLYVIIYLCLYTIQAVMYW